MMKILIIEDDSRDCQNFIDCVKHRQDFEIVGLTGSDIEGLSLAKSKRPDGIILDIELNNSKSLGNANSLDFISNLRALKLDYWPIIIVTTHVNSKRTYDILHRNGADLILYKGHPKYSCNFVLNQFLVLNDSSNALNTTEFSDEVINNSHQKISEAIDQELNFIGVTPNLKGRQYIHDAILYLIENPSSSVGVVQYLTKIHKKSGTTITNGIQNAIIHAWRVSSIEDLSTYYTAKVNYETGVPTPMEFIYYYVDKIKKVI